jgi:hypothetical protein
MRRTSDHMRSELTPLPCVRSLLLIAGLLSFSLLAQAQISLVQVTSCASPGTTCTIPATGSGHLIVVGWSSTFDTTPTITSISDNAGNTYFEAGSARSVNGSSDMGDIWYAYNSNAGATTLTITPNPSGSTGGGVIWEFSNVDLSSPLDQTSVLNSQPATTTPTGASVTTTAAGVIISIMVPGGSMTGIMSGNAFTNDSTFFGVGWAHLVTSAAGTYAAQWNTGSGTFDSSTVSFKAASSGGGGGGPYSRCDLNQDGVVNVVDVQLATDMYLGGTPCTADIDLPDVCTPTVVNRVVNAALGEVCVVNHQVTLNWTASSSTVSGYNVYRGTTTGGPYTIVNSSLVAGITYVDTTVTSGTTYYYVTQAVNSSNELSAYSNEAQAIVPYP